MRYLLDTHIVIWAMVGSEMLSDKALDILHSSGNTFYLSSASVWEVAIKHSAKPNEIPDAKKTIVMNASGKDTFVIRRNGRLSEVACKSGDWIELR